VTNVGVEVSSGDIACSSLVNKMLALAIVTAVGRPQVNVSTR
jgi:hypothetical protein